MKRQNSIPQPLKQNSSDNIQRRKSHESGFSLNSVISSGTGMMENILTDVNTSIQMPPQSILTSENNVSNNNNCVKVSFIY